MNVSNGIEEIKPNTTYICGIDFITSSRGRYFTKGKEYTSDENGRFTADNGEKLDRVGVACGFKEKIEKV